MPVQLTSPNTVLANALIQCVDLLRPRIARAKPKRVDFVVGTQINGTPHIGTNLTQCAAFVLAREVRNAFSVEINVIFGALDNAPKALELDPESFHSYQITYRHALGLEGVTRMTEGYYRELFEGLSDRTAVDYSLQMYSQQQASPTFRRTFLSTLPLREDLRWIVAPANGIMHVRLPCPTCHKAEKRGERTRLLSSDEQQAVFEAVCFDHGKYEVVVSETSDAYLDLGTLYRNLVKEAEAARADDSVLTVMVKGGDWSYACPLIDWGLGVMGVNAVDAPVRWFTPQIVTDTGAKLSKSLISRGGMQSLQPGTDWVVNTDKWDGDFDDYLDALVGIVVALIADPKNFFRSYSYTEIDRLMKSQTPDDLRDSRARLVRIYRKYFDLIASGAKTIEIRVGYSSMKKIQPGQLLKFSSQTDSCLTRVVAVRSYPSFQALMEAEDPNKINPGVPVAQQLAELSKIFPPDKEALGALAIELTLERD